jgi:tetratricopeptide (TPR) repeat protein
VKPLPKPRLAALLAGAVLACGAWAQPAAPAGPPPTSDLDSLLFYQLLIGEMQLREGHPGAAFSVILDAARRTRNEQLFRRAVDIALQARAGDEALAAARAWRSALPASTEALRTTVQLLGALNRPADAAEPLRRLISLTPEADRNGLIASLPRLFRRSGEPRVVAGMLVDVLEPYLRKGPQEVAARTALGAAWLAAGETANAWALASEAARADPVSPLPVLLALELMPRAPQAEALVQAHLARADALPELRLSYARALAQSGRPAQAVVHLEAATRQRPDFAPAWLTLGALHVDLREPKQAEQALQRYVELVQIARPHAAAAKGAGDDDDEDGDASARAPDSSNLDQAWLLRAQAAEQRGDYAAAEAFLLRVDSTRAALDVQTRRATIAARQGRVEEARQMVRKVPERSADDARAKLVAEAQVLREVKRWPDAFEVLRGASDRWPEDTDLMYELSMVAEKLDRLDTMEKLLRRVIALRPDSQHAYNALGYSLADRGLRLPEARTLIAKALELAPGDPFITDSLGWVEFRLGNLAEAQRLLRQAYAARPDTEIAAHLGEVLWASGQKDEARHIWREGRARDPDNEVLRDTLARLKPGL